MCLPTRIKFIKGKRLNYFVVIVAEIYRSILEKLYWLIEWEVW